MITNSPEETKALAKEFVQKLEPHVTTATVVELVGDLGAGKTTFMQGVGAYFGLTKALSSPTFVIGKHYDLPGGFPWKRLIHIDAYRIEHASELGAIGWERYVVDPGNIIFVEWPTNMQKDLGAVKQIVFNHINENQRDIAI